MNIAVKQENIQINLENLPSVPHTLIKLIDIFQDFDADFKDIANLIQQDPSLTIKMVEVANTANYAQYQFKSFEQMLVVLGMDSVKTIATTAAVQQFFSQFNSDTDGFVGAFWLKSLHAAYFSKALAKLVGYSNLDEAYLGGLIHQIGQLILLCQHYQEYAQLIDKSKTSSALYQNEIEQFGISSAEFGAQLIASWNMNSMLEDAVLYQDATIEQLYDSPLLIQLINLSHKFCLQASSNSGEAKLFTDQVYQLFNLTEAVISDLADSIQADVKNAAAGLGVNLNERATQISNSEEYSLQLASRVKNIALGASLVSTTAATTQQQPQEEKQAEQIVYKLMQNIHIVFGLADSLFFSYNSDKNELYCSAQNINYKQDLDQFKINIEPVRSLIARAYTKKIICSSFENKDSTTISIVDKQLIKVLKGDGILCIPLFNKDDFYGELVIGISLKQYPGLLEQRLLLGEFSRTTIRNFKQIKNHQSALEQASEQQNLHIRKLIHEANNPLTIISNYLQILSLKMQNSDKDASPQIEILQQEVERVAGILLSMKEPVNNSLDSDSSIMENTNINLLIKELISVFQSSLFHNNQIIEMLRLDENIPEIQCDRNGLKQVLINLIKNAAEAMIDGGIVEIETHDLINMNGQQYIELSISDTGPGINEDILSNLFNPVSTTKGGNHAGLGLSIVKSIIDKLQGMISCQKREQAGVKFVILLPRKIVE
ncbi:MAG: HDOD domain-containing protein [Pseudomonadota bacterium]